MGCAQSSSYKAVIAALTTGHCWVGVVAWREGRLGTGEEEEQGSDFIREREAVWEMNGRSEREKGDMQEILRASNNSGKDNMEEIKEREDHRK